MIPRDPDLPRPLIVFDGGVVYEDFGRGLEPVRVLSPGRAEVGVIRRHNSPGKLSRADVIASRAQLAQFRAYFLFAVVSNILTAAIGGALLACALTEVCR
jgi:hypothetical protein